jgi:hypothetical protein
MHEQHTVLMQPNLAGFIVKVTVRAFPRVISFAPGRRKIIHRSPPEDTIGGARSIRLDFRQGELGLYQLVNWQPKNTLKSRID